jgi:hypothetical protein
VAEQKVKEAEGGKQRRDWGWDIRPMSNPQVDDHRPVHETDTTTKSD